ncbi:excisionase [Salmonella enterica subsp. houtenae]|uniref:Excisionase n=4 Tax=Salmonella enterica TaxID=28901 RepID=A0A3Y1X1I7_SALHO|nr:excisionase [Salmonella enterica]EAA7385712.1 excisionase [Salmonella enterica subsp. enterica]EBH8336835.1 excisionase [Salmonella enterica subsp. houtenae serovar Houten]ECM3646378.1 excisionase [Salmonella enterica subsp. enterica serovar Typhimurium]EDS4968229.1 excisionase [Salmonella enterica subsp. enterica serovar O rough]EDT6511373.1 excisionase [Salmonella enterica subsp. enterica serovar Tallahassee]EGI6408881.1 excisionase [Salmonella enterica subsp. houtenae serovar 16:z4,z32:
MARMVSLEEWAEEEFGELAPSLRTLKKYAKGNMMAPPARKVGREWMIDFEARFIGVLAEPRISPNANPKLRRIIEDGC